MQIKIIIYKGLLDQRIIKQVMDSSRIEDVIGEFIPLKKRGANLVGICPFHGGRTPSLYVSPQKGIFKCFTCGEGGDVIAFLKKYKNYNFVESINWLANKYNISLDGNDESENIVFIDTEVGVDRQKVQDYGAVRGIAYAVSAGVQIFRINVQHIMWAQYH